MASVAPAASNASSGRVVARPITVSPAHHRRADAGARILEGEAPRGIAAKALQAREIGQWIGLGPFKLLPVDRLAQPCPKAEHRELQFTRIAWCIGHDAIGRALAIREVEKRRHARHHGQPIEHGAEPLLSFSSATVSHSDAGMPGKR